MIALQTTSSLPSFANSLFFPLHHTDLRLLTLDSLHDFDLQLLLCFALRCFTFALLLLLLLLCFAVVLSAVLLAVLSSALLLALVSVFILLYPLNSVENEFVRASSVGSEVHMKFK